MKVALVGAGLIGQSIAHLLRETGDFDVVAFDRDEHALALIDAQGIPTRRVDSADTPALRQAMSYGRSNKRQGRTTPARRGNHRLAG